MLLHLLAAFETIDSFFSSLIHFFPWLQDPTISWSLYLKSSFSVFFTGFCLFPLPLNTAVTLGSESLSQYALTSQCITQTMVLNTNYVPMTPKSISSAQGSLPGSRLIYPISYLSSPLEYKINTLNPNVSKNEFLILLPKLALTTIFQYQLMATPSY